MQVSDPSQLKAFEAAQEQLSSALSRLMVVVERYPDLKADQQFLTLQAQLEGTENRIAVARRDYIEAVRQFNTEIRTFPGSSGPSCFTPIWKPNPPSAPSPVPMRRPRSTSNERDETLAGALSAALCHGTACRPDFPALTGRVVDEANLMSRKQAHQLAQQLAVFEKRSGVQLVVVSIDTLAGIPSKSTATSSVATGASAKRQEQRRSADHRQDERKVRIEVGGLWPGRCPARRHRRQYHPDPDPARLQAR